MNDLGQFRADSGQILIVFAALLIAGWLYNKFVSWLHREGLNEGFTWLEVGLGVLFTLLATVPIIGWNIFFILLGAFACSGLFMALGDIWRYVKAREAERKRHVGRINGDQTP